MVFAPCKLSMQACRPVAHDHFSSVPRSAAPPPPKAGAAFTGISHGQIVITIIILILKVFGVAQGGPDCSQEPGERPQAGG